MLFKPGDVCKTVGGTVNCHTAGRIVTIRKPFEDLGIQKYIVRFEDGDDNYEIEGSPGYVLREYEMLEHDCIDYEVDE